MALPAGTFRLLRPADPMRIARLLLVLPLLALTGACATAPGPAGPPAAPVAGTLPPDIHWVRTSAEHRAIFLQVYRNAADQVREIAAERARGGWAVILDADETVLDNSLYQRRLAERGEQYASSTWNAWVREEAAAALPGAAAFIELVHRLGGRVAIVTNRDQEVCGPTRRNLEALGIEVDVVLCQRPDEEGKTARFRAVEEGTTGAGLPPLEVVLWVGDNIHDFPGLSQGVRDASATSLDLFGRRYFILPNPMYGSWESNPPR